MKYGLILITALTLQNITSYSVMTIAKITVEIEADGMIQRFPSTIATEELSYVAGGVVFNYPIDTYTIAPNVAITVAAAPHASSITYTAELTANSTTSSTVRVYKISGGSVTEAASGEVNVIISARGL